MKITAYRIAKAAYATTLWRGIGARTLGGRWNSKGVAVVYTAQSRSLAAMEQLVHLVSPRVLCGYVVASVEFDEAQVVRVEPGALRADWNDPVAPASVKKIGDDWVAAGTSAVLAVPSVVMAGEWNYLLNPGHAGFAGFVMSAPEAFGFDPRLR